MSRAPSRITPYLLYEDVAAALDFLSRAFGFREVLRLANVAPGEWGAQTSEKPSSR